MSEHWTSFKAHFDEFVDEMDDTYDLIVSNPPFYAEDVASSNQSRDKARQNSSLPFDELIAGVSKFLTDDGIFSVIIPFKEEDTFIDLAKEVGLYCDRITRVKGNPDTEFKRSLMEFSFHQNEPKIDTLVIEKGRHSVYSTTSKALFSFCGEKDGEGSWGLYEGSKDNAYNFPL